MMVRALGLQDIGTGPTPMTAYSDNSQIADWAKKELLVAQRLGLVGTDANGNINPTALLTKAEAAGLINHLIEYMSSDLQTDYTDHIVNYAN